MNAHAIWIAGLAALSSALPAHAQPFAGADLALGQRLITQHRCAECHAQKVGGNGDAIYRRGKVTNPERLRTMVEMCSTQLNLQLFPEEIEAVAAVLNRDHYRFK